MNKTFQTEELKSKKSIPINDETKNNKLFHISAAVGKVNSPMSDETRHVAGINIYSQPNGDRIPRIIGTFKCTTYSAPDDGLNPDMQNSFPNVVCFIFPENSKNFHTASYCAAQGLWEGQRE